jgi:hypothetical protein
MPFFLTPCAPVQKIFALTGCTAICIICYCVPVYIHLKLKYRLRHQRVRQYNHSVVTLGMHQPHGGMARAAAAHAVAARAAAEKLGRSKPSSTTNLTNGNINGVLTANGGWALPDGNEHGSENSPVLVVVESAAPWLNNPPRPLVAGTPPSSRWGRAQKA